MSSKNLEQEQKSKLQATDSNFELVNLSQEEVQDEVLRSFSREFEQNLRQILGEEYREFPKNQA